MIKVCDIKWDLTDDVFDYNIDDCDIPTEVDVPKAVYIENGFEGIADYLSDIYGFCVKSFNIN